MKKLFFILTTCGILFSCGSKKNHTKTSCKSCSDFKTQKEAKRYAKSHADCRKELDTDHDGVYCEDLPKQ